MIETEQPLFDKRGNELNGEKWIPMRLVVHQSREGSGVVRHAAERIRNEPHQVFTSERRKSDLLYQRSFSADSMEFPHQRMCQINFVVSVSADHQQVLHVTLDQEVREHLERRCIEPLQIIKKERQRVFAPRENAEKSPKYELETALCLLRGKLRDRRLFPEQELQFRNNVDYEPP